MPRRALKLLSTGLLGLSAAVAGPSDEAGAKPKFPREHYQWCMLRHVTYRALDNTYVDAAGRRVQCASPYVKTPKP